MFTKMVLDGFEEKEREKGRLIEVGLPEGERWGNDGLVTLQSARWGEYLGTLEESDHWSLRGSKGREVDVELASVSGSSIATPGTSSMGGNGSGVREGDRGSGGAGDAWSLGDWTKFVGAWKKEEKSLKNAGAAISSSEGEKAKERQERLKAMNEAGANDEVVKASAEKLSAVFDWIVDQVPSRASNPSPTTSQPPPSSSSSSSRRSDLSSKADLERFYVALCRKLYDEGL